MFSALTEIIFLVVYLFIYIKERIVFYSVLLIMTYFRNYVKNKTKNTLTYFPNLETHYSISN